MSSKTAKAPAKLILSGEHAVVQGCPALATAVDLYTSTTVSRRNLPGVLFEMADLPHRGEKTRAALKSLKDNLQDKYNRFRQGKIGIRDVLKKPFELIEYTTSHVLDKFHHHYDEGFHVHTNSDIPNGCGMGSSAASIVSTNFALSQLIGKEIAPEEMQQMNIQAENLQHGKSSGLDVHLCTHGGCHLFHGEQTEQRKLWNKPLILINTGKPASSTGECVTHSKKVFKQHPELLKKFTAVTKRMDKAWQEQDIHKLKLAIKANHKLLVEIGVVPERVQDLIKQIEKQGGAAKICGAGAIHGDHAGIVWVEGAEDFVKELNQDILTVHSVAKGVQLLV